MERFGPRSTLRVSTCRARYLFPETQKEYPSAEMSFPAAKIGQEMSQVHGKTFGEEKIEMVIVGENEARLEMEKAEKMKSESSELESGSKETNGELLKTIYKSAKEGGCGEMQDILDNGGTLQQMEKLERLAKEGEGSGWRRRAWR